VSIFLRRSLPTSYFHLHNAVDLDMGPHLKSCDLRPRPLFITALGRISYKNNNNLLGTTLYSPPLLGLATAVCCLAVSASNAHAFDTGAASATAHLSTEKVAALDSALEHIRSSFNIPGLAVGIAQNNRIVYAKGFGVRDLRSSEPVTAQTLFECASITKTFTALAVMQLVEQKKIALQDPVARYLPAFAGSGILVSQLLTHSAGLRDWFRPRGARTQAEAAVYLQKVARHDRAYAPGTGWEYSDTDFNVLGMLIEAVSGKSYSSYVTDAVLAPAGMSSSTFEAMPGAAWPHRGRIYVHAARDRMWDLAFLPSSGLQTNVIDLLQWSIANMQRRPSLLSRSSYKQMFTPQVLTAWPGVAMGLGWQLEQRDNKWLPRHPGGNPGFRALLTLYPQRNLAIVILSNGETTPRWEIRETIEAILADRAVAMPRPSLMLRWRHELLLAAALLLSLPLLLHLYKRRRVTNSKRQNT
jgi:CubicO group peptidase (beta-lactamase class C family)